MGNLKERFLTRMQGFVNGDGSRDSAVYLDGHVAYVDVMGDAAQGAQAAFVVRGLNNNTNAPTELFRINKDGTTSIIVGTGGVTPATLSSITLIGGIAGSMNFASGTISDSAIIGGTAASLALRNSQLVGVTNASGLFTTGTISDSSIFGGLVGSAVILNPTITNGTFGNGQINAVVIDSPSINLPYVVGGVFTGGTFNAPNISNLALLNSVIASASLGTSIYTGGSYDTPNITNQIATGGTLTTPRIVNGIFSGGSISSVVITNASLASPFMAGVRISSGSLGAVTIGNPTIVQGAASSFNISSGVASVNLFTVPRGATVLLPVSTTTYDIGQVITPGSVVGIHGKIVNGTSVTFNFRKNGATSFLPANLTLSTGATYTNAPLGSLQNVPVASGDYLELVIGTVTGSVASITAQLDIR
jgi:hypothetical protein